eukprot:COSAG06_NODE_769_length_12440_cov_7.241796_12_plen_145_part_00
MICQARLGTKRKSKTVKEGGRRFRRFPHLLVLLDELIEDFCACCDSSGDHRRPAEQRKVPGIKRRAAKSSRNKTQSETLREQNDKRAARAPLHDRPRHNRVPERGAQHSHVRGRPSQHLQENGTFFELFLCLSRACLGKMSIFI